MEKQNQNPGESAEMPQMASPDMPSSDQAKQQPNLENQSASDVNQTEMYMEWFTMAYRRTEKTKSWYIGMGGILAILIAYDLYSGGWVVSLTFLILAGVYYLSELKPTPILKVGVNQLGIRYGTKFYAYDQIKSFWILNQEDARHLNLTLFKGGQRNIDIIIPIDVSMAKLRDYLILQIPEEEGKTERFSDQLIRNIGL